MLYFSLDVNAVKAWCDGELLAETPLPFDFITLIEENVATMLLASTTMSLYWERILLLRVHLPQDLLLPRVPPHPFVLLHDWQTPARRVGAQASVHPQGTATTEASLHRVQLLRLTERRCMPIAL